MSYPGSAYPTNYNTAGFALLTPEQTYQQEQIVSISDNLKQSVAYAVPGAALGFIDTLGQSIFGADENTIANKAREVLPSFGDYYSRNKEGLRIAGDIVGMFAPAGFASGLIRSGSAINRVMGVERLVEKAPILSKIMSSGRSVEQVTAGIRAFDAEAAANGVRNFTGSPFVSAIANTSKTAAGVTREQLISQAYRTKLADTVKETVAQELAIYGTMNQSDFLFPDDMSLTNYLAVGAGFTGAFAAAEALSIKAAVRLSAATAGSTYTARALNPENFATQEYRFTPMNAKGVGGRDVGLVQSFAEAIKLNQISDEAARSGNSALRTNAANESTAVQNTALSQVSKLFQDTPFEFTSRSEMNEGQGRLAMDTGFNFPEFYRGVSSLQGMPKTLDELVNVAKAPEKALTAKRDSLKQIIDELPEDFEDALAEGKKSAVSAKAKIESLETEIAALENQAMVVLDIDGNVVTANKRKPRFYDLPDADALIKAAKSGDNPDMSSYKITKLKSANNPNTRELDIEVTRDGILSIPPLDKVDPYYMSAAWQAFRKNVDLHFSGNKFVAPKNRIKVADELNYTQADYLLTLGERSKGEAYKYMDFPESKDFGVDPENALRWRSLKGKYAEYVRLRGIKDNMHGNQLLPKTLKNNPDRLLNDEDIRMMLNMPASVSANTPHPLNLVFGELYMEGITKLEDGVRNVDHLIERGVDTLTNLNRSLTPDFMSFKPREFTTKGDFLDLDYSKKPILATKNISTAYDNFSTQALVEASQQEQARVLQVLSDNTDGDTLVSRVTQAIVSNESLTAIAMKADTVVEGAQRGKGIFFQQQWATGDNAATVAAFQLQDVTNRQAREIIGTYMEPLQNIAAKVKADRGSSLRFSQYLQSRRQAWDLKEKPANISAHSETQRPEFAFQLGDTKANRERWLKQFGYEMPKDEPVYMPQFDRKEYTPVIMDENALALAGAIDSTDNVILGNLNQLRKSLNLGPISRKEWHVPARNLARGEVRYIIDDAGQLVEMVHAPNINKVNELAAKVVETAKQENKSVHIVDQKQMGKFFNLSDDAFYKLENYSDAIAQTGRASGKSSTSILETGDQIIDQLLEHQAYMFEGIVRRTRSAVFAPQINYAQRAHLASGAQSKIGAFQENSEFQRYITAVRGDSTLSPNSLIGTGYRYIENSYDYAREVLDKKLRDFGIKGPQGITANIFRKTPDIEYRKLREQLGGYMPFGDAQEMLANTYKVEPPASMKKDAAKLNGVISALTLRMFDAAHPIMNILGTATTLPSVIRSINKGPGESVTDWQRRVGNFAITPGSAEKFPVFHPTKAAMHTMHSWFNDDVFKQAMQTASSKGYFRQEIVEQYKTLTDPQMSNTARWIKKTTDTVSWLSDKSEDFARGMAFGTGYLIGRDINKMAHEDMLFAFAHKFANDVIGDYRPNVRPQIFSGAVGMPLGLFQTYTLNFFQRMFGYVENKQWRALGTQYASTAAVFGGSAVPGFDQIASLMSAGQGEYSSHPIDRLNAALGAETTDFLLYGGISTGTNFLNLYTRGDTNVRSIPTLLTPDTSPAAQFFSKTAERVNLTIDMMKEQGFSTQQMTEILARTATNRFMKGMLEISAGSAVDSQGQVVSNEVRSAASIAARALSLKPFTETRQIEIYSRLKDREIQNNVLRERLRESLRSAFRGGDFDGDTLQQGLISYVRSGGNPANFSSYLKEMAVTALSTKNERKLKQYLSSQDGQDFQILMNSGVLTNEDFE